VQNTAAPSPLNTFVRYRITWLAYGFLAYMTFMPTALGPLMPYMREELNLSYTLGALHLSVMALGVVISGLTADRLIRYFGRRRLLWLAITGSLIGTSGMVFARVMYLTLPSALLMGITGSCMLVTVQAVLSEVHGERRTVALTESNVAASLSSLLAPLWVSFFLRMGFSWRLALAAALVGLLAIAVFLKGTTVPENSSASVRLNHERQGLPALFWICWAVIVLVVAIEWSLIFWSADYLEKVVGLARVDAVSIVSVFFLAMLIGRAGGSLLARRYTAASILLAALLCTAVGFPLFWLGSQAWMNVAGLFIAGIGVANLFPLAMSTALSLAPGNANIASSRITLASGSAIFSAPLVLGWLADQISIQSAYGVVVVLLIIAILTVWMMRRQLLVTST
jgi:MFS family permease